MSSNNDTSNEAHNQAPIEAIPEPTLIEEGIISKRGPFPLRLWQKRYLAFPSSHQGFSLYQLRTVYKKNVKKSQSNRAEFEKANKDLFETLATATVNTNAILAYYKVNAKDLPQGLINLKHVKSVERAPRIKSNAFIIHSKNRDYVFSAPSKDETDLWVTSIQNRLNSEMFDYDDTEAFKFSYDHLVNRKGFFPPASNQNEEEVFSASEAEFVSDEVPSAEATSDTVENIEKTEEAEEAKESEVPEAEDQHEAQAETTEEEPSRPKSQAFSLLGIQTGILAMFGKDENKESTAKADEETQAQAHNPEESSPVNEVEAQEQAEEITLQPESESQPEPTNEETRPFLVRLLSGNRKSKIETPNALIAPEIPVEAEAQADAPVEGETQSDVPESVIPETEDEEDKRPFLARILSGKRKSKIEVAPVEVAPIETELEVEQEQLAETAVEEATEDIVEEAQVEEPEARPFLVRLLSGKRKSTIEPVPVSKESDPEVETEAETPVETEEPETSEIKEDPKEEPKEEPNLIRRILSGRRKSTMEPTSPKAEEPVETPLEEVTKEEVTEPVEVTSEPEEPETDKRPFIVRVLSGKRKSLFGSPTSPKPQEEPVLPAEENVEEGNNDEPPVLDVENTEAPFEAEVISEEPEAVAVTEVETEKEPQSTEEAPSGPARQPSLISRIGELAYSAVVPAYPAAIEEEEELNEHYQELSKEAIRSGYITKQSYLLHSNNQRFAILNKEGEFIYYRSGAVVSEGKKIILDKDSQIDAVDELSFNIKSQGQAYTFLTKLAEERDLWVKVIQDVIESKQEAKEPEKAVEVLNEGVEEIAVVN